MKVLLDENLPHRLRYFLADHEVRTVTFMGWSGVRNSELVLRAAAEGFDALVTMDRGIWSKGESPPLSNVVLRAPRNTLDMLLPLVTDLLLALGRIEPATRIEISSHTPG